MARQHANADDLTTDRSLTADCLCESKNLKAQVLDLLRDPEIVTAIIAALKNDPAFTFVQGVELTPDCYRYPRDWQKRRS